MRIWMPMVAVSLVLAGASSRVWSDEKSHRAAAEEMLKVMNMEKAMEATLDRMLSVQVIANPQLEPLQDVMKQFLAKYASYSVIKDDLIQLYTAEFTEAELKEITAFYRSPTGKKTMEKLPVLVQKGSALGLKRVQAHMPELKQMIQKELEKNPKP